MAQPTSRHLLTLPEEVLFEIFESMSRGDVNRFMKTCRGLDRIGNPVLYNLPSDQMYQVFEWAAQRSLEQPMLDLIPPILHAVPKEHRLEIKILRLAIGNGSPDIPGTSFPAVVRKLLENGVSPNLDGFARLVEISPLMQIAQDGRNPHCLKIVRFLLAAGADINALHSTKQAAIHYAARGGNVAVLKELVQRGANVNHIPLISRITPLRSAVCAGHLPAVEYLVSQGGDVNQAEIYGWTPLMTAVETKKYSIVDFLMKNGADPNRVNCDGLTALHFATQVGQASYAECLVNGGCDVSIQDNQGKRAVDYTNQNDQVRMVIERGPQPQPPPQWGSA